MTNKQKAEVFAQYMLNLMIDWKVSRSTAHKVIAVWYEAVEHGDFGV